MGARSTEHCSSKIRDPSAQNVEFLEKQCWNNLCGMRDLHTLLIYFISHMLYYMYRCNLTAESRLLYLLIHLQSWNGRNQTGDSLSVRKILCQMCGVSRLRRTSGSDHEAAYTSTATRSAVGRQVNIPFCLSVCHWDNFVMCQYWRLLLKEMLWQ